MKYSLSPRAAIIATVYIMLTLYVASYLRCRSMGMFYIPYDSRTDFEVPLLFMPNGDKVPWWFRAYYPLAWFENTLHFNPNPEFEWDC